MEENGEGIDTLTMHVRHSGTIISVWYYDTSFFQCLLEFQLINYLSIWPTSKFSIETASLGGALVSSSKSNRRVDLLTSPSHNSNSERLTILLSSMLISLFSASLYKLQREKHYDPRNMELQKTCIKMPWDSFISHCHNNLKLFDK